MVVGAGAAGLMAACELARAGRHVTILEARDRLGGRIFPLPEAEFGYGAEGGAEFVHGAAPVTRALMREAGFRSRRATARDGAPVRCVVTRRPGDAACGPVLSGLLKSKDLPVAEFL